MPFQLGCCPDEPRCVLCPPPPKAPSAEVVEAFVVRYREDRAGDRPLFAAFFGGAPPPDTLIKAAGLPSSIRVRPDLLSRKQAQHLADLGVFRVELDALSFDDRCLKRAGRQYRGALVIDMLEGLRSMGFEVGIVLAPGLPGSTHESCVRDAEVAAPLVDFARLHPVLVLEGSRIRDLHMSQIYRPLELEEAVGTCRAMMDALEAADVEVIRVGVQPVPDGIGRAVAGPRHSSLRQLVESERTLSRLQDLLAGSAPGSSVAVRCAPEDETRARGPLNRNIRTLRADHALAELKIIVDSTLERGAYRLEPLHSELL
ncbi:MAG: radical SAM protein [Proteobacteria bacterium]|nr:radical SAM protein [Pseudomonadota bacterium]